MSHCIEVEQVRKDNDELCFLLMSGDIFIPTLKRDEDSVDYLFNSLLSPEDVLTIQRWFEMCDVTDPAEKFVRWQRISSKVIADKLTDLIERIFPKTKKDLLEKLAQLHDNNSIDSFVKDKIELLLHEMKDEDELPLCIKTLFPEGNMLMNKKLQKYDIDEMSSLITDLLFEAVNVNKDEIYSQVKTYIRFFLSNCCHFNYNVNTLSFKKELFDPSDDTNQKYVDACVLFHLAFLILSSYVAVFVDVGYQDESQKPEAVPLNDSELKLIEANDESLLSMLEAEISEDKAPEENFEIHEHEKTQMNSADGTDTNNKPSESEYVPIEPQEKTIFKQLKIITSCFPRQFSSMHRKELKLDSSDKWFTNENKKLLVDIIQKYHEKKKNFLEKDNLVTKFSTSMITKLNSAEIKIDVDSNAEVKAAPSSASINVESSMDPSSES